MGTSSRGLHELIADLASLPERAAKQFPPVLSKGALNIKTDWRTRWRRVSHLPRGHIPHLIAGVDYHTSSREQRYSATIGVAATNRQAFLASIITYGTLTSAPHDAGRAALEAEAPRFERAVGEVAQKLLDGSA